MKWYESLARQIVEKDWGKEYVIENTNCYCCKVLEMRCFEGGSYHAHVLKDETFVLLSGAVLLLVDGEAIWLSELGQRRRIGPNTPHLALGGSEQTNALLEISTCHSEDDVIRYWRLTKSDCQETLGRV